MGRKLKSNGYVARQQLNVITRSSATANRVFEQLLEAESVQMRATLIAQAAILNHRISSAAQALQAIWVEADDEADHDH